MPDIPGGHKACKIFKRFGYRAHEPAAPQLCRLLKLSNKPAQFKSIQTSIENLGEKYLDTNAAVSNQKEVMSLIEDKIISRHPHLFAGQKNEANLIFALRVVKQKHRCKRQRFLERERREIARSLKGVRQPREVLDLTLDKNSDSEHEDNENIDQEESHEDESSGSKYADNENLDQEAHEAFRVANKLPSPPARRMPLTRAARAAPNTTTQDITVNKANRNTNKRPLPSASKPKQTTRIRSSGSLEVKQFLSACNPPMNHYLQRFIEFGCNSLEYFRGISSWAPEKRHAILKKILTGPESESAVSEMDLAVIENKLETYFVDEEM